MRRKTPDTNPFWLLLALIFLFEAWLWDHLEPLVARVVNVIPWGKLKVRLANLVEDLPPWAMLIVFVVPLAVVFAFKVLGLWLLAQNYRLAAIATLVLAKLVGLGVTAFVFDVTRDKLLQLRWFRRLYDFVMWLRDWAHALVDPVRHRMQVWLRLLKPARSGRLWKRLANMRRRMRTPAAS
jgi:hypothetical protein